MLKFKNSTTFNQNSLSLHAEQVHGKFPLCFKSSLNSCRDLHSFNFIGRLLHETLPLKFKCLRLSVCVWNEEGNTPSQ